MPVGWITLLLMVFFILTLLTEPVCITLKHADGRLYVDVSLVFFSILILPRHKKATKTKSENKSNTTSLYLKALLRIRHRVRIEIDTLQIPLPLAPPFLLPFGTAAQYLLLPLTKDLRRERINLLYDNGSPHFQISFFAKLYDVLLYFMIVKEEKRKRRILQRGYHGRKQNG